MPVSNKLELKVVTLCEHCHKAISLLNDWRIGWLHFSTHDGHKATPMKPLLRDGVRHDSGPND